MDVVTLAQIVTSVTNTLFVIVLAAGYYYTWRVSQNTLAEMRAQRTAMGRPLVIVQEVPGVRIGHRTRVRDP
jgi:hypothetical protein